MQRVPKITVSELSEETETSLETQGFQTPMDCLPKHQSAAE